jgi:hypothetical protein
VRAIVTYMQLAPNGLRAPEDRRVADDGSDSGSVVLDGDHEFLAGPAEMQQEPRVLSEPASRQFHQVAAATILDTRHTCHRGVNSCSSSCVD